MARPQRTARWKIALGALVLAFAGLAVVYNFFPRLALDGLSQFYELRSGVADRSIELDGYRIPYYEGGAGPALVLVHGFGDSRLAFLQTARWLVDDYRVILPTVPGFGDTAQDPGRPYGIRGQAETLRALVDALGIQDFYLVGNSMGGHIAASFVLRYPERVKRLVLLNPAGLRVTDPVPYKPENVPEPVRV